MDWVQYITLGVSIVTLMILAFDSYQKHKNRKIDRIISVNLEDKRKKQSQLLESINSILAIEKSIEHGRLKRDLIREHLQDITIYQNKITINLNRENSHARELSVLVNELAESMKRVFDDRSQIKWEELKNNSQEQIESILMTTVHYIEDEDRLYNLMVKGKTK